MCRFVAYMGKPVILDDVLYKPTNSLVKQSIRARETTEPLNGDGFGVGWYAHQIDYIPALYTSILPAWNDRNLLYIAPKVRTHTLLAHVRAASAGGLSIYNTHPFHYDRFLFMHNGDIAGFHKIKRYLRRELNDEIYEWIKGQTDSEHFFGLFLNILQESGGGYNLENLAACMRKSLNALHRLQDKYDVVGITTINAVLTDGFSMIGVRYVSGPEKESPTLYYAQGSEYQVSNGNVHIKMNDKNEIGCNLIVSERLTNMKGEWHEIPANHLLLLSPDLSLDLQPI